MTPRAVRDVRRRPRELHGLHGRAGQEQADPLGIVVLLFLGVLFFFAYWLKREYWKDLH